jgi:hypothetical protein
MAKPQIADLDELRLAQASDHKVRRVVAVVDDAGSPALNRALLDPLRPRLSILRPVRPLRFTRLLFLPFDPLTVPLRQWRTGDAAVPRPALAPIARQVHAALGQSARDIDALITHRTADAAEAINQAGELLWPHAATLVMAGDAPFDWADTDLPLAAYRPLVSALAAVLRRAVPLRRLANDDARGVRIPDEDTVLRVLENIDAESKIGCAMIARLILALAPHATCILRRIPAMARDRDRKAELRDAVDLGLREALTQMEQDRGGLRGIADGAVAGADENIRRASDLLSAIASDADFATHRPRVAALRAKLDQACRTRFSRGVREGLEVPLGAASARMEGQAQTDLEVSARDLRKMETEARKLGGATVYDTMLSRAADTVGAAEAAGALTSMGKLRLIEILSGADAAEAIYRRLPKLP